MPKAETGKRVCCMISEMLEEAGLDRERVRGLRRQVLEGVVLYCQWQLERMAEKAPRSAESRKGRKVTIE